MKNQIDIIIIIALVFTVSFLVSCKPAGITTKETFDSTYLKQLQVREAENNLIIGHLESLIREMDQAGITFDNSDCDTTIVNQVMRKGYDSAQVKKLFDVLAERKNKIELLADGTLRAEGKIKSFTKLKERLDSSNQTLLAENKQLREFKDSTTASVSKFKSKEIVKTNKLILLWLIIFIAGAVTWDSLKKPILFLINKIKQK